MSNDSAVPVGTLNQLTVVPGPVARRRMAGIVFLFLLAAAAGGLYLQQVKPPGPEPRVAPTESAGLADARARAVAVARAHTRTHSSSDASGAPPARIRTADSARSASLFATHSWYVPPPPPPAVKPPPPAPPSAPPFPYSFVGSYSPDGQTAVYFLARGDRVIDARVGDKLDGVFQFESAEGGKLTFNYLPLNIRQSFLTGAPN